MLPVNVESFRLFLKDIEHHKHGFVARATKFNMGDAYSDNGRIICVVGDKLMVEGYFNMQHERDVKMASASSVVNSWGLDADTYKKFTEFCEYGIVIPSTVPQQLGYAMFIHAKKTKEPFFVGEQHPDFADQQYFHEVVDATDRDITIKCREELVRLPWKEFNESPKWFIDYHPENTLVHDFLKDIKEQACYIAKSQFERLMPNVPGWHCWVDDQDHYMPPHELSKYVMAVIYEYDALGHLRVGYMIENNKLVKRVIG